MRQPTVWPQYEPFASTRNNHEFLNWSTMESCCRQADAEFLPPSCRRQCQVGLNRVMLLRSLTAGSGTLLPRANAAACPQLAKADFASSSQHVRDGQRMVLDDMLVEIARTSGQLRRKKTCER